jgi:ribosome-associated heat shock protein Hsp15
MDSIRIDKYLWAIRTFKTRSIAGEACKAGKVKMDGKVVKASREVRVGDLIEVRIGMMNKVIEIKEVIKNRLKASLAVEKYIDRTPKEELERMEMVHQMKTEHRDRGTGRPTKKDRREMDRIKNT